MTFDNNIGCEVKISSSLSIDKILFSETGGFILEVSIESFESVYDVFSNFGIEVFKIGYTGGSKIKINNAVDVSVEKAKNKWLNGLRNKL